MKSFAKINIFLKITGKRGSYHEIASRFLLIKTLYDDIEFIKGSYSTPTIEGKFSCDTNSNIIYKSYLQLLKNSDNQNLKSFFSSYKVVVTKRIPEGAGLGGGSSNAATFLKMINSELSLGFSIKQLIDIGANVGADVPFFISGFSSANVFGIGEKIEEFKEEPLNFEINTPNIHGNTAQIYATYSKKFFNIELKDNIDKLLTMSSLEVLKTFDILYLNDLYQSALEINPELIQYQTKSSFFSGSGSSFFRLL